MSNKNAEHPSVVRLEEVDHLLLPTQAPYNFRFTFWKPSHFPTGLEAHAPDVSWRTFRFGPTLCGVRFEMRERKLEARVYASGRWCPQLRSRLAHRLEVGYGLSEDLTPFLKLARTTPEMALPLSVLGGMRMSCPESLFEIAIVSLLLQNTTIHRSIQMMNNLLNRYGALVCFDEVCLRAFFSPEEVLTVQEGELRAECRLGYRAKYLPEFAKFFSSEDDDALRGLPADTIMSKIQRVKGVGPYTAGIIASHALRDPSTLALDVWNTKLFIKTFSWEESLNPKSVLAKLEALFPGYVGLAGLYIIERQYLNTPMSPLLEDGCAIREFGLRLLQSFHEGRTGVNV